MLPILPTQPTELAYGLDLTLQVLFGRVGSGRVRFRAGRVRSDDPTGAGRVRYGYFANPATRAVLGR